MSKCMKLHDFDGMKARINKDGLHKLSQRRNCYGALQVEHDNNKILMLLIQNCKGILKYLTYICTPASIWAYSTDYVE